MDKKYILILLLFIIGIVIVTCIFDHYRNKDMTKKEVKEQLNNNKVKKVCVPFTGGSFNIIFNTDGGEEIPPMHIGIAVSPDSYDDLPTPTKEGYTFDGWYYNKKLTKKVVVTNSKDITPVPDKDIDDCVIGFKDIEMFAKWK